MHKSYIDWIKLINKDKILKFQQNFKTKLCKETNFCDENDILFLFLGLRDMFRENFEQLQLRLYQLDRLIEANLPDLHIHFQDCGLESHMYASQWFLTGKKEFILTFPQNVFKTSCKQAQNFQFINNNN